MKRNKNDLDEMQRENRNRIGNQMFLLMSYALLLDSGLYGAGIRRLGYPANVMVILVVCTSVYLIRTIAAGAYLSPKAQNTKTVISLMAAIALAIVAGIAAFNLLGGPSAQPAAGDANDFSALILFAVSAAGLLVSLIAALMKKRKDRRDGGD